MTKPKANMRIDINQAAAGRLSDAQMVRGVRGASIEAERITKDILSQPGRGRVYKRGGTEHRASAPGDSPAPDTGELRNSTSHDVLKTPVGVRGRVSVNKEYAAHLEFGTEKMRPRPFLSRLPSEFGSRIRAAFVAFSRG